MVAAKGLIHIGGWRGAASVALRLLVVGAAVGLAFLASTKLLAMEEFVGIITAHGVVPAAGAELAAWAVVAIEFGVAALVARDAADLRRVSRPLTLLAGLLALFAIYAFVLTVSPPPAPVGCGCGWSRQVVEDWSTVCLRNSVGATVCALAAIAGRGLEPCHRSVTMVSGRIGPLPGATEAVSGSGGS